MHCFLIEKIRNKIRQLSMQNWTIHFRWLKAHIRIVGNEAANRLAKEAAQDEENQSMIPLTSIASEINRRGLEQWQWNSSEKGATCRSFFPRPEQKTKMKLPITPEFTDTGKPNPTYTDLN
jgi:hypothetical protein